MHQPANAPTCHGPSFGEAVDHKNVVVWIGNLEERRGVRRTVIDECAIYLVADNGDAALAREVQHRALLVALHDPTCWIARRRYEDRLRALVTKRKHFLQIKRPPERPFVPIVIETCEANVSSDHFGRLENARPNR